MAGWICHRLGRDRVLRVYEEAAADPAGKSAKKPEAQDALNIAPGTMIILPPGTPAIRSFRPV